MEEMWEGEVGTWEQPPLRGELLPVRMLRFTEIKCYYIGRLCPDSVQPLRFKA